MQVRDQVHRQVDWQVRDQVHRQVYKQVHDQLMEDFNASP